MTLFKVIAAAHAAPVQPWCDLLMEPAEISETRNSRQRATITPLRPPCPVVRTVGQRLQEYSNAVTRSINRFESPLPVVQRASNIQEREQETEEAASQTHGRPRSYYSMSEVIRYLNWAHGRVLSAVLQ